MCDELGNEEYMQAYVEEAGNTGLCQVGNPENCSEKEQAFITKWAAKSKEDQEKQYARLQGMQGKSMKAELKKWLNQRASILKQLLAEGAGVKEEL